MIAKFPQFAKLDIHLKKHIRDFTSQFEPYSDFNFTSLFSWNVDDSAEISSLNDNLVIKMPDYLDGQPVYSILGKSQIDQSIDELLNHTRQLKLVPEIVVENIVDKSKYTVREDRDNFDYIYSLDELSKLENGKYKKIRNKVNSFAKAHEQHDVVLRSHHSISADYLKTLNDVAHQWTIQTNREKGDTKAEREALGILLNNFEHFNLLLVEIVVNGEVKGFSINEVIANKYAICHFEKALLSYHPHTYTYMISNIAQELLKFGCLYINWEQDLGLEGLRQSKMSYHPTKFLKKYTISANKK